MDNNIVLAPESTTDPLAQLLNPVDAAKILHVSDHTLVRWARLGYVPAHPIGLGQGRRRTWRFYEHELVAWANAQTNNSATSSEEQAS
jgi:hypothetical protein